MKFKIIKHKEVVETNVFGKPARIHTYYTIERVVWFSFRSALEFKGQGGISLPVALSDWSRKVVQCCNLQPSKRSNSGYKTIKVTDIACENYELRTEV